jgi:hypothetical protein
MHASKVRIKLCQIEKIVCFQVGVNVGKKLAKVSTVDKYDSKVLKLAQ